MSHLKGTKDDHLHDKHGNHIDMHGPGSRIDLPTWEQSMRWHLAEHERNDKRVRTVRR